MKKYLLVLILFFIFSCACYRRACPPQKIRSDKSVSQEINSETFVEISLLGGGIYGGINPVSQDKKVIENNGTILISYKQLYTDGKSKTLFTSRGEVEELAKFIHDNGFFAMKNVYDCSASDKECKDRKTKYPPAVPLRIKVTIGNLKKEVKVTVYDKRMINYPDNLKAIVNKINEVISQAGKSG